MIIHCDQCHKVIIEDDELPPFPDLISGAIICRECTDEAVESRIRRRLESQSNDLHNVFWILAVAVVATAIVAAWGMPS